MRPLTEEDAMELDEAMAGRRPVTVRRNGNTYTYLLRPGAPMPVFGSQPPAAPGPPDSGEGEGEGSGENGDDG